MTVIKTDVEETVGSLQVCGGQFGGCEAAIHAMRTIYEEESTDAILLIDAANAFNSVNRAVMLQNIQRLCPIAYTYAFNCYAPHARLFVIWGTREPSIHSADAKLPGDINRFFTSNVNKNRLLDFISHHWTSIIPTNLSP